MRLNRIRLQLHPILGNVDLDLVNKKTGKPYAIIAFVGENGCGKTTFLREIFNYRNSPFVVREQSTSSEDKNVAKPLFIRQGSAYVRAMNDIRRIIDGKEAVPSGGESDKLSQSELSKGLRILKDFGDKTLEELFATSSDKFSPGEDVLRTLIGGDRLPLTSFSGGEVEIALKMKELLISGPKSDVVLLDEPETSLHPRWQQIIVCKLSEAIQTQSGEKPQLFISTHSERVLESFVGNDDVLIVRMSKENGAIKVEPIERTGLLLPRPTFAEMDYVVFGILSYEYHDQLFWHYGAMIGLESIMEIDKKLRTTAQFRKGYFHKQWVKHRAGRKNVVYQTLPAYIRNWFHHPEQGIEPSRDELAESIDFLRALLLNHK